MTHALPALTFKGPVSNIQKDLITWDAKLLLRFNSLSVTVYVNIESLLERKKFSTFSTHLIVTAEDTTWSLAELQSRS